MAPTRWGILSACSALAAGVAADQEACRACGLPDASALFQRESQRQPGLPIAPLDHVRPVPPMILASRKKAVYEFQGEMQKMLQAEAASQAAQMDESDPGNTPPIIDASTLVDQLPALMDSLRDDNFIRSFLEFEDQIEKAGARFEATVAKETENFIREFAALNKSVREQGSSVMLAQSHSDTLRTLRVKVAHFMDHYAKTVVPTFPQDLVVLAEAFRDRLKKESSLSQAFADIFVPMFVNVSNVIQSKSLPAFAGNDNETLVRQMNIADLIVDESGEKFCGIMSKLNRNLTRVEKDIHKATKTLNSSRKMMLPLVGQFMTRTLPDDASQEDKDFPPRFMLVLNYEVDMFFSVLGSYTSSLSQFTDALTPVIRSSVGCGNMSGAAPRQLGFFTVLVALAASGLSSVLRP